MLWYRGHFWLVYFFDTNYCTIKVIGCCDDYAWYLLLHFKTFHVVLHHIAIYEMCRKYYVIKNLHKNVNIMLPSSHNKILPSSNTPCARPYLLWCTQNIPLPITKQSCRNMFCNTKKVKHCFCSTYTLHFKLLLVL